MRGRPQSTRPQTAIPSQGTLRSQLVASDYDMSIVLDVKMRDIINSVGGNATSSGAMEKQLFALMSDLCTEVTSIAKSVETELVQQQLAAKESDSRLHSEVESHEEELELVAQAVDSVIETFHRASEGALRIGEQLASAERERKRIENALDIMECVRMFETADPNLYNDMHTMEVQQIRDALPSQ